jgi:glycosyltransferase involved in cell wall biosynthesis
VKRVSRVHAWVELIHHLDASAWPARNTAGEVPNRTPFGIGDLARHGVDVTFRSPLTGVPAKVARRVRRRSGELEYFEALAVQGSRRRRSADVVLCWDEFTGVPAAAFTRLGGPPVVSGVQLLTDPDGRPPQFLRRARSALRRMDAVFVQSKGMLPVMLSTWEIPSSRLHFVPFGVDPTWFRPAVSGVDRSLVVSVGDDPHRDHVTLVRALSEVQRRLPDVRLELATQLDVDLPPSLGVLHRGHLGPRRRQFYGTAAVVAVATQPNIHGSGMSVVLEAMACGRPYVVTASAGLEGYVRHGHDGLVVPPGNIDMFARAVEGLLADPQRADGMGAAGRARLVRELTTDNQAKHLADVLRSVVP